MPRHFLPLLALLALTVFAQPATADPPAPLPRPSSLRSDILYTHKGEFVQVSPMRALTLNAHVSQFAYDPLGLEIAYVGSEPQGENTLHFVKTVDVRTGHEISRLTLTAPTGSKEANFLLLGFSRSGKYLLLQQFTPDPNEPSTAVAEFLRWDLSANPPTARTIIPAASLPAGAVADNTELNEGFASPDGHWIGFRQEYHELDTNGKPAPQKTAYLLYDPEQDTFRLLTLPPKVSVFSWSDNTHLKFYQEAKRKQFSVVTGEISLVTTPFDYTSPAVSKQYPDLSLDTQSPKQLYPQGGSLDSYLIWIRRTPFGGIPLGAAAAGLMPRSVMMDFPGSDDPHAVWSPTGRQAAFIANDNLYVTDLSVATDLLPHEKMAVGLKLSCAEEQELAVSSLKQIGLGIIQFTQDDDEKYPDAKGLIDTLQPYLKSTDVFEVEGHHFVYEKPAASLRDLESPATTENGYMDLPCARVVLFCDGHVKVFAKEPTP